MRPEESLTAEVASSSPRLVRFYSPSLVKKNVYLGVTVAGIRSGAGPTHCKSDIKLAPRFFFDDKTRQIAPAKRRSYTFTHVSSFSITQAYSRVISIAQQTSWH